MKGNHYPKYLKLYVMDFVWFAGAGICMTDYKLLLILHVILCHKSSFSHLVFC